MQDLGPGEKFDLSKDWYTSADENGQKVIDESKVKKYITPGFALFNYPTQKIKVLDAAAGANHLVSVVFLCAHFLLASLCLRSLALS